MNISYNKHYIRVDGDGQIVENFSDAFKQPEANDICINERGGYQRQLFPDGEENPDFLNESGIPLYKWDGKATIPRTDAEIQADIDALPLPVVSPTEAERLNALESAMLAVMIGGVANV